MAGYRDNLFCSQYNAGIVSSIVLTKTELVFEDLIIEMVKLFGLHLYEDWLYVVDLSTAKILRIDVADSGTNVKTIQSGLVQPKDILLKDDYLYSTETDQRLISRNEIDNLT